VSGLGDVIAAQVDAWGGVDLPLERTLFGTTDPHAIASAVDACCVEHLGAPVARYRFFDSSSGSVHGVELTDGRAVVVKGHRPDAALDHLTAALEVQRTLAAAGFPAPAPLAGPTALGPGHLTAELLLPQHRPPDSHAPEVGAMLAAGLARFVALAAREPGTLRRVEHPLHRIVDGLYPVPHSPRFDFAATGSGAEWIDDLMRDARARLAALPPGTEVVAHGDWRVQNLSVRDGRIDAVYDWDSVAVTKEMGALAAAATTFGVDWSVPQARRLSTPDEIAAFAAEYADARGAPLTDDERIRLARHLVVTLAYGARCEHADRAGRPPQGEDSQRSLLRTLGPGLLADGLSALG
jgi:Ser/Thr protein kinase RdoA (MazF antagonist)